MKIDEFSEGKKKVVAAMERIAAKRDKYIKRSHYYYKDMKGQAFLYIRSVKISDLILIVYYFCI